MTVASYNSTRYYPFNILLTVSYSAVRHIMILILCPLLNGLSQSFLFLFIITFYHRSINKTVNLPTICFL